MSILQRNLINLNSGLSKNIFGEKEPNVFFNSKIKSTNLPQHYFTNYIDSRKNPLVNALKEHRRRILKKQVDYDSDYEIKNIIYRGNEKAKFSDILQTTLGYNNINYAILFRLKSRINPVIQFYFLDDCNGNYEVLFVDIYHLALPAPNKARHEKYAKPKKIYAEHRNAKFDIENIFNK